MGGDAIQTIGRASRAPLIAALAFTALRPVPAHAQFDGLIDRLVRPPPSYPYYYRPPPAYPPPYYPPPYRPAYPPPYAPTTAPPRPVGNVEEAQRMLGVLGYDAGPVDGVPGPRVGEAVRAFQRDHGQAPDGLLGGETMAALRAAFHEREAGTRAGAPPAAAAATASKGMPTEGKYCIFYGNNPVSMLLVRDGIASVEFGWSAWGGAGHFFSVYGNAGADGGQFRYESGMTSKDPTERCRVTLTRLPDGGFRAETDPEARCEAQGGQRAVPREPVEFPATSRSGNPPRSFAGETLMQVGCDRRQDVAARAAPSPGLIFPGSLRAGTEAGTARFRFECSPRSTRGDLALDVVLPDVDRLQSTIDLNGLEGPYPKPSAPHVTVRVEHPGGGNSAEAGFYGNGSRTDRNAMAIGLHEETAGPHRSKMLATAIGAVTEGPSTLVWSLDNPAPNSPPLEATLAMSAADATGLRQSLRSCLP